jgi:homeobox-leucine zipper protein
VSCLFLLCTYVSDGVLVCLFPTLQLEHVSNVTSKHLGRPFTLLEPTSATVSAPSSSLNLSVRGMSGGSGVGDMSGGAPGLEFDHLGAGSSAGAAGMGPSAVLPFQMPAPLTNMERPMMMRTAAQAMDELTQIAQAGEHLWIRGDERDTLIVATYEGLFSNTGAGFRPPDVSVEGSRVGSMVFMSAVALVDVFMDTVRAHSSPFVPSCCPVERVHMHAWRGLACR